MNWRQRKKALGLCSKCRQFVASGKTMCHHHLDELKTNRRNRIASSRCVYCNGPSNKKTICKECSSKRALEREERKVTGLCVSMGCPNDARPGKTTCGICSDKVSLKIRILKQTVLSHYGQKCNCLCGCPVTKFEWLTIDHKNNDGAQRRREEGSHGGHATYRRIIKAGFPDNLQVLCFNCNCAKEFYGGCQ